jgi:hypothetical protein
MEALKPRTIEELEILRTQYPYSIGLIDLLQKELNPNISKSPYTPENKKIYDVLILIWSHEDFLNEMKTIYKKYKYDRFKNRDTGWIATDMQSLSWNAILVKSDFSWKDNDSENDKGVLVPDKHYSGGYFGYCFKKEKR